MGGERPQASCQRRRRQEEEVGRGLSGSENAKATLSLSSHARARGGAMRWTATRRIEACREAIQAYNGRPAPRGAAPRARGEYAGKRPDDFRFVCIFRAAQAAQAQQSQNAQAVPQAHCALSHHSTHDRTHLTRQRRPQNTKHVIVNSTMSADRSPPGLATIRSCARSLSLCSAPTLQRMQTHVSCDTMCQPLRERLRSEI